MINMRKCKVFLLVFLCIAGTFYCYSLLTPDVYYYTDTKLTLTSFISINETTSIHSIYKTNQSTVPALKPTTIRKTKYPLTLDSHYLINNPNVCEGLDNLTFIVIVHTAPSHFERRFSIRQTWANKHFYKNLTVRIVFLLGKTLNNETQFKINNENSMYHDLVQGDFLDSYRNLTHKGVLGFRWITENCLHAEMVIKVDDDVFVNIFKLYQKIFPLYKNSSRSILCHVRPKGTSPIVRSKSKLKWTVNDNEFRGLRYYPITYCNGYAVFISPNLIRGMYQAAFSTPFFWIDDVYLYGLLPAKMSNVVFHSLVKHFTLNERTTLECFANKNNTCKYIVGNAWHTGYMNKMWLATLAKLDNSSRSLIHEQFSSKFSVVDLKQTLNEINMEVGNLLNLATKNKKKNPPQKNPPPKNPPPKNPPPKNPPPKNLPPKNLPPKNPPPKNPSPKNPPPKNPSPKNPPQKNPQDKKKTK
ncbi:beta-1,3-galactosyltransferase 2-like [Argonauta hians]